MKYNDYCPGFGIAYKASNKECEKCDEAKECERRTKNLLRRKKTMNVKKMMKEAIKIKDREDLIEWIEDNDIDIDVGKRESVKSILKKIKEYLEEEELQNLEDDPDDDPDDDDPDDDDPDDDDPDDDDPDDDDPDDDEDDPDDDPDDDEKLEELEKRIEALEKRIESITEKVQEEKASKKSRKMGNKAKEERKLELLNNGPYKKEELTEMSGRDIKLLASALNINTFGMTKTDAIKNILKAYKKSKKKSKK